MEVLRDLLEGLLPNADLVVYPDAGHGGIFQFHEQFVREALDFLLVEQRGGGVSGAGPVTVLGRQIGRASVSGLTSIILRP
ncbi:hypothetical protein M2271_006422 [Streptomyces sp. LBL]|uniref:hypothetical protein n=1 Tax=Streptomyces sp. LBL TaxID=2940562 RepID=UPI002474DE51|nr:hypothetical protein [Streptomyces sp. LBL]MDH6628589.1 hypothetical protein [Streptomyces sp. LBL]